VTEKPGYVTGAATGCLALTDDLTDSSVPVTGAGFYYLVRPDCGVGSWQTSLGAEPGRDLELP